MDMRRLGWMSLALLALALLVTRFSSNRPERPASSTAAPNAVVEPHLSPPAAAVQPSQSSAQDPYLALQQGSLQGTHPDGSVTVGLDGRLQPDMGLRRLFDYYLGLIGETDLKGIRRLLGDELARRRLPPQAMDEALADFDKYVRLQRAINEFAEQPPEDPLAQLKNLQQLRQQILGTELAQAFYADQERGEQALARRLRVARDQTLSAEQKRERVAAMAQQLDPEQQAEQKRWRASHEVDALNKQLDAAHADADTRYERRAAEWGGEAADRMARLDQQRLEWQQRLNDYRQARQAIDANRALSETEKQAQQTALLQSGFSHAEQARVRALLESD